MKKTIYASSMFFACALAFVSCGQKTPEMTLEEIEDYRAHAGQHLLERTVYKPYTGQEFIPGKEGGIWNDSILADPKTFNHLIEFISSFNFSFKYILFLLRRTFFSQGQTKFVHLDP